MIRRLPSRLPRDCRSTFESGTTDFGALDPQTVDLATTLVMEFALTYGNAGSLFHFRPTLAR
jgi:hypothetical protein